MISIKRKTFALVIFSVLALLVAQGCQNSSASVPAASASSDTQDTNISIDTSPDTTDPVLNVDGNSGQIDSEPADSELADSEPTDTPSEPTYNRSVPVFGKPAPDISAAGESTADINEETLEHGVFNLSESVGKPTIIHFWTAFCGENCSKNLPKLQHAYETYGDQVNFIGIFVPAFGDIEQDVRDVLNGYNVTFPNLIDSELKYARGYSLEYYPFTVFLSADHTQKYERSSIRDLEASIELLLTDNPVPDEDQNGGIILDLLGETFDHGFFNLDSSLGRGAVTYFWAPSCEGCVEGLREVQKLYERYSESDQVEFIGIFSPSFGDSEQDARQIIADEGITFPNLADSDMTLLDSYLDRWGGDKAEATLPTFYMVDQSRDRVVYSVGRQIEYERLESSLIRALFSETTPVISSRTNKPIPDTISDGESSTDINEETLDHGVFNLSEYVGKPTIIQFWASFCGANCTRNLPKIQYAYERYSDQINFIGIFVPAFGDLEQDVRDVLNDQNITFPHLIDSELKYARGYSLEYYPLTLLRTNADPTSYQYSTSGQPDRLWQGPWKVLSHDANSKTVYHTRTVDLIAQYRLARHLTMELFDLSTVPLRKPWGPVIYLLGIPPVRPVVEGSS